MSRRFALAERSRTLRSAKRVGKTSLAAGNINLQGCPASGEDGHWICLGGDIQSFQTRHDLEVWNLTASGKAKHQHIETISSTLVAFSVEDREWHKRKKLHHRILNRLLLSSPFATRHPPVARGER